MTEQMQFIFLDGDAPPAAFEYFCCDCGSFRLSLTGEKTCGNCKSTNIIIGKIGELDRDALKAQFEQDPDGK